jgi:uncharacterized membrane protein YjgN (DUF898 family)
VATYRETLVNVGLVALLIPLTAGLAYPYFMYRMKKHIVEHSCFGQTRFKFNGDVKGFYRIYFVVFVLLAVPVITLMVSVGGSPGSLLHALSPLLFMFSYFLIFAYIETYQTNYILNHAALSTHRFASSLSLWSMFYIYLTNVFGAILSLGLLLPWSKVRLLKYKLDNLKLLPGVGLQEFVNDEQAEMSALGEEISDLFDIDIGL